MYQQQGNPWKEVDDIAYQVILLIGTGRTADVYKVNYKPNRLIDNSKIVAMKEIKLFKNNSNFEYHQKYINYEI